MNEKIALIGIVTVVWAGLSIIALRSVQYDLKRLFDLISNLDMKIYRLDWNLGRTEIMIKMIRDKLTEDGCTEEINNAPDIHKKS